MKGKILISVLFCLILVFGMLIASCDNDVYPDWEKNKNQGITPVAPIQPPTPPTPPTIPPAWANIDEVGVDFYVNSTLGSANPTYGGDNKIDVDENGEDVTMSVDAALALLDKNYYGWTYASANIGGKAVIQLKVAP